jgi:hypothetical protein
VIPDQHSAPFPQLATPRELWQEGAQSGRDYAEHMVALLRSNIYARVSPEVRTTIIAESCLDFLVDKRADFILSGCTEAEANIFAAAAYAVMMGYFKAPLDGA